jgi:hypothetical protein
MVTIDAGKNQKNFPFGSNAKEVYTRVLRLILKKAFPTRQTLSEEQVFTG